MTAVTAPGAAVVPRKYRRFTLPVLRLKVRDRLLQFTYAIPMGHIAIWVAVAAYFIVTQKIGAITDHWNDLFPWIGYAWSALIHGHNPFAVPATFKQSPGWEAVRHDIRDGIFEGELAAGAAIIAFANALRPHPESRLSRTMNWLMGYTAEPDLADKFMNLLRIPNMHQTWKKDHGRQPDGTFRHRAGDVRKTTPLQYIFVLPAVLLTGIPGNALGFAWFYGIKPGFLDLLHDIHLHLAGWSVTAAAGTGAGATEANLARAGFDAKVIGILGTLFFARRIFLKVGLDYQEFLAQQHAGRYVTVQHQRLAGFRGWVLRPRWPLPATYRGLVWHDVVTCETTGKITLRHSHAGRWVMLAILPVIGYLAWYGQGILAAHGGV